MNYQSLPLFIIICTLSACTPKSITKIQSDWTPLLESNTLSNFDILNGSATYRCEGNTIVGVSISNSPNTFLCTKEKYGNFILEFEVWADPDLNSGVQFRSKSDPQIMDNRVHGYQVEIESSDRKWAGGIYEEGLRGWLYPLDKNPEGQSAFKVNEWNQYRVEAIGNEIITWVNGIQCAHLFDNGSSEGFIGLQVHSIGDEKLEGKNIKWRNLRILTSSLAMERWIISGNTPIIDLTKS